MGDIIKQAECQQLDIFVKRILCRYLANDVQIFFQEGRDPVTGLPNGTKEPVKLYINNGGIDFSNPVQCISEVILSLIETPVNTIICNSKSRIAITYKVFLLVKFQGLTAPSLVVLPDDIGTSVLTEVDLTLPQYANHENPKEILQIVDNNFVYTTDIPLCLFDCSLTPDQLCDPTLQSHVLLKCMRSVIDVDGVGNDGTGTPPVPATTVTIAISEDILDKIGIDQDIYIHGIPEDFICCP